MVASSSTERPIVPPGAGRVLEHEPQTVVRQREELGERRNDPGEARVEPLAEVRADVEDHALRADRRGGLERRSHRRDRLGVDLGIGAREVDEVERVAHDRSDPDLVAA